MFKDLHKFEDADFFNQHEEVVILQRRRKKSIRFLRQLSMMTDIFCIITIIRMWKTERIFCSRFMNLGI